MYTTGVRRSDLSMSCHVGYGRGTEAKYDEELGIGSSHSGERRNEQCGAKSWTPQALIVTQGATRTTQKTEITHEREEEGSEKL